MSILPPATNTIKISYTVPAEIVPYLTEFYNAEKRVGETKDEFAFRMLKKEAKEWWVNKQVELVQEAQMAAREALKADVETVNNL